MELLLLVGKLINEKMMVGGDVNGGGVGVGWLYVVWGMGWCFRLISLRGVVIWLVGGFGGVS